MENAKLQIQWSMSLPPLAPKRSVDLSPQIDQQDGELESRLGMPGKTMGYLRAAFASGADRKTSLTGENTEAVDAAARIFKRGVATETTLSITTSGSYDIVTKSELKTTLQEVVGTWIVIDHNVASAWPKIPVNDDTAVVHTSEVSKTLATVADILDIWRNAGKPKHWSIIGGGLLADAASFAAALVGAEFTLFPTTLLAMADACVGGKTGVNFPPFGKNQVGLFAFPRKVVVFEGWLKTLSKRHRLAGVAECLKHAILVKSDEMLVHLLRASNNTDRFGDLLSRVIKVKADIVSQDPAEVGVRATLNFGHTLAHALEAFAHARITDSDHGILHGEAVGIGMAYAALLSEKLTGMAKPYRESIINAFVQTQILPTKRTFAKRLGVTSVALDTAFDELCDYMLHDKKSSEGKLKFVLLDKKGDPHNPSGDYLTEVDREVAKEAWALLLGMFV